CADTPLPLPWSRLPSRQRLPIVSVCWRDVDVQRLELAVAGVPDFVPVSPLDEHQRASAELDPLPVHDGQAGAGDDGEPLIRAPVAIVRPALSLAGRQGHLGGLTVFVAQHDAEAVAELQVLVLHGNLLLAQEGALSRLQNGCLPADL